MEELMEPLVWRILQNVNETNATSTNSNTTDSSTSSINHDDSQVLRDTMMVYGSALVIGLFLFCWARRRFPKVYNTRNWVDSIKSHLAEDQHGYFSWMWKLYMVTDDELLDECGMDAMCFIRIAQMGYKLS